MVTRDATTTISAGRRTRPGISGAIREITRLEKIRTAMEERPIPMAFVAFVVTANVGQRPSAMMKTGFSVIMPFFRRSMHSFIEFPSFLTSDGC